MIYTDKLNLLEAWDDAHDFQWNHVNTDTDTEVNFVYNIRQLSMTISFQGSGSFMDWWQNFRTGKEPYKEMKEKFKVHRGFIKKYHSVRDKVHEKAEKALKDGYSIKIRGFSQGAALSVLAHEDIFFNYGVEADTIVFGCPRVFTTENSKVLEDRLKKILIVTSTRDLVTKVPFSWLGFRHYGEIKEFKGMYAFFRIVSNHFSYPKLVK